MVKHGSRPLGGVVAEVALLRKACGDVIRVRRLVIVSQVAGDAVGAQSGELVVHVAPAAGQRRMRAGQRELGLRVVE